MEKYESTEKTTFIENKDEFVLHLTDLIKDAGFREDFYESTLSQDIEIPNFPTKPLSATWRLSFGNKKFRGVKLSINRKDENSDCLAEISVDDRWDGTQEEVNDKPHYFDVFHRFVHRDKMNEEERKVKGVGSFILKKVENILRLIEDIPKEIGILTNQPDVIHFAEINGYKIKNERQEKYYQSFMKELDEHKNNPLFINHGVLPSFRLVNLQIDTPNGVEYTTEGVIINIDMLKKYCDDKKPNYENYSHLLEVPDINDENSTGQIESPKYAFLKMDIDDYTQRKENMRSDQPHPFLMDFYFSKTLTK